MVKKIIEKFCDSPYISQYNYLDTINELIDIFYYYKNETMDEISDDELIGLMYKYYNSSCQGSLELLKGRELDRIADNIKYGVKDYLNISDYMEEYEDE